MATAQRPAAGVVPELASVTSFGLTQLKADALVVLDQRGAADAVVASTGTAADELVGGLGGLPSLAHHPGGTILTSIGAGMAISVAVAVDGGEPIGTMHVLYRGPHPDPRERPMTQRATVVARQIALVLARRDVHTAAVQTALTHQWLVDLNVLPSSPEAIAQMTTMVARGLRPRLGSTGACITVWDEERSVLRALPGAFGSSSATLGASISGPPTNSHSLASRVFVTGRPYMTNRALGDPGLLQRYVDAFRLERVLAVPLTIGSHRVGVLILVNKPAPFTIDDVTELEALAPQIAIAVKLALAMEKIRRSQRMERILATAATEIASARPPADCFAPALRDLGQVTDSSLAILSPRFQDPLVWRGREVEASLERRFLDEAGEMARCAAGAFPHDAGDPGWAAVHAPVMFAGERVAAVSLLRQTGMPFGADETETVSRTASLAALAWASERYQRQVAELTLSRERARIADDLHDHVAQILFAAQIGIDSLRESEGLAQADDDRLIDIRGLLTKGEAAIREVINDCAPRPPTDLIRRLEHVADSVREEFRALVDTELPPARAVAATPREVADCMVKVAHEGVVNAAKHAGRCRITLRLSAADDGSLTVSVLDEGMGAPDTVPFAARHGLTSIARSVAAAGGTFRVLARAGGGTHVTARFAPDGADDRRRLVSQAAPAAQGAAAPAASPTDPSWASASTSSAP